MRRVLAVACALPLCFCLTPAVSAQLRSRDPAPPPVEVVNDARIDRLTTWLEVLDVHEPGVRDAPLLKVRAWTGYELRALRVDAISLVALIANPRNNRFTYKSTDTDQTTVIGYTKLQHARLRLLACVAGGTLDQPHCAAVDAGKLGEPLRQLAAHAAAARLAGDRNYMIRRGALLHTDLVTLTSRSTGAPTAGSSGVAIQLADGAVLGFVDAPEHWEIGSTLLDRVLPATGSKPAPAADPMVRDWYEATGAWMEAQELHSTQHLNRARDLFPNDPAILFLAGCQHEGYAAPSIQEPIKQLAKSNRFKVPVEPVPRELHEAETLFRRALAVKAEMSPARLRLAHVLLLQRRYADAARETAQALPGLDNPNARYYAELFAGMAAEGQGHYDLAREAYVRASALYPSAQSPYLALGELESRRGNGKAALRALDHMFAIPVDKRPDDPWWWYYTADIGDPSVPLQLFLRHFARPVSE